VRRFHLIAIVAFISLYKSRMSVSVAFPSGPYAKLESLLLGSNAIDVCQNQLFHTF
jgi:hypothetical protein